MGTFAETAFVDYCFSFADQRNKRPFSVSDATNKLKFAVSVFRLEKTSGSCRFLFAESGYVETWIHGHIESWKDGYKETWTWSHNGSPGDFP
jgi:hypothetical protein